ncbi:MAG TPA: glycoside hydrolase family 3 N-terminal domain-containing protein [Povalibacter sp.]|uniref:glycoside hydrolase family 3 N-terminal domain-containing protein n=1 Tax=Povalibacter sp. TaxID=1962978 RepID=UPI002B9C165D|nr:glycoside hydrolase family 3 N-terminal domain-containing protein [Povalibacter sp.]HMN46167.1 glycoside hydrolase family 3 N-terminal domain-containing protein [Povalibacter sp.]
MKTTGTRLLASFAVLLCLAAAASAREAAPVYKDPQALIDARVEDLLGRMTLEEKIAQITTVWTEKNAILTARGQFDSAKARQLYPAGIGQFGRPSDLQEAGSALQTPFRDERDTVELINAIQRHALTQTRLGIPVLFHEEGLHGYAARNATSFPQSIALASSWDPQLLERIFTVVAREIRARGVQQVLAPVVDVARDPRWGRIEETYGEDPYLVSELGVAVVRGFQGESLPLAPDRVLVTLKHMTGHGQPESGTNVGPASISERVLRTTFFPPFAAAIKRGNAQAVMASYNEIDGIPSHANRWLLQDILRGEMGFQGAVVSDYFAIEELIKVHQLESDGVHAAARALNAGVDIDLPDGKSFSLLPQALQQGLVTQQRIDEAVRRMLRLKFLAGMFESPYADAKRAVAITGNAEARALALEAARKSVVLLKNDGTLPLRAQSLQTLAVIGPNAARVDLGGYSNVPRQTVSVLDVIRTKVGSRVKVTYAEGVRLTDSGDWYTDEVTLADPAANRRLIAEAVAVAKGADSVVLVIGGTSAVFREAWATNHLGDRDELGLIGEQQELADAIFALGKPVTVVLINGQPLSIPEVVEKANALVEGWYAGQEGGTALADILFGDANPGGKLPVTIARSVGQLPMYYAQKPSAHRGYHFDSKEPLFPFGFGLSYTTFEIGTPRLSAAQIGTNGTVDVSVDVRNTGALAGDEVVQLYVRDVVSSVTRPLKELKGFRRVSLQPGAATTVTFKLGSDELGFWNEAMKFAVEPGEFTISAGANSVDLKSATLVVAQ